MPVHRRDPGLPPRRRVELGEEHFRLGRLAHEVVGGRASLAHVVGRQARLVVHGLQRRRHRVEQHLARHEAGVTEPEVEEHDAADVAARDRTVLVAEHVVHERVAVDRVRRDVVEVVGREARVAVPAEVGGDHLEARVGEWADVAPPDALGLRVPVEQQQRDATDAFAYVRDRHAVADFGVVRGVLLGIRTSGHAR